MKAKLAVAVFALSLCAFAQDRCAGRAQVLVVGTYHMANPGRDVFNMDVDDVRSPKRQKELEEVSDVLKKFAPTRIAIESPVTGSARPAEYQQYLQGKHELSRNEVEQIGYRLGKALSLPQIDPVDVEGDFPFEAVQDYAKRKGRTAELQTMLNTAGKTVQEENEFLKTHTALQMLLRMNSDAESQKAVDFYMQSVQFSEPGDYAGADLVGQWYMRNIRIFSNIRRLVRSPEDRVLVLYGAGHLAWLQQDVENDSSLCLRKLSEFAK